MSVYTPQQVGQPQMQQPYGQQQAYGQPQITPSPYGQQPWGRQGLGQFNQQPLARQGQQQLPLLVTEVSLRCAAPAVTALLEQLRMDPQILMAIQAQGQIPPHAWNNVLTECARRIAPVVHTVLAQITGQGVVGQQPQFGQHGQFQGMGGFVQQPQFGPLSPLGM
ncbi:hypothetical protein [Streptomyces mirabilis]|uniref:hypothetical protein n=1 Tax=Streptomyces mirabilis TaxID=68239 RepID=UPI00369317E0